MNNGAAAVQFVACAAALANGNVSVRRAAGVDSLCGEFAAIVRNVSANANGNNCAITAAMALIAAALQCCANGNAA